MVHCTDKMKHGREVATPVCRLHECLCHGLWSSPTKASHKWDHAGGIAAPGNGRRSIDTTIIVLLLRSKTVRHVPEQNTTKGIKAGTYRPRHYKYQCFRCLADPAESGD
jgi:hypothetical protein